MSENDEEYGLSSIAESKTIDAPQLDYLPPLPKNYRPKIGLIGAGGITEYHLKAYQRMGLDVVAICDLDRERAAKRRDEFYPQAEIFDSFSQIIDRDDIEVFDIATHPEERVEIVKSAILAGKHVLSQKPFVVDLEVGRNLVELAAEKNVQLAVNQNGRWAPHFSYLTQAIRAGVIGDVSSIDFNLHWDHTWTQGTPFEEIHHLLLYDFAIHWFDITCAMMGNENPVSVFASVRKTKFQTVKPPFIGHVVIDYPHTQVRICLNAHVEHGQEDRTVVAGSRGTLRAFGPGLNDQQVELWNEDGVARPQLEGNWFKNGFEGTMGELLCAIDEDRLPSNHAAENLRSLKVCFAAIESADTGRKVLLSDPSTF